MNRDGTIALIFLSLAILTNAWKYVYMCYWKGDYKIFPWQPHGNETTTSFKWISLHLTSCFILLGVITSYIIAKNIMLLYATFVFHFLFCLIIAFNAQKLGSFATTMASVCNISTLLILTMLLVHNKLIVYMAILMFPVWLESITFINHMVQNLRNITCYCNWIKFGSRVHV